MLDLSFECFKSTGRLAPAGGNDGSDVKAIEEHTDEELVGVTRLVELKVDPGGVGRPAAEELIVIKDPKGSEDRGDDSVMAREDSELLGSDFLFSVFD